MEARIGVIQYALIIKQRMRKALSRRISVKQNHRLHQGILRSQEISTSALMFIQFSINFKQTSFANPNSSAVFLIHDENNALHFTACLHVHAIHLQVHYAHSLGRVLWRRTTWRLSARHCCLSYANVFRKALPRCLPSEENKCGTLYVLRR